METKRDWVEMVEHGEAKLSARMDLRIRRWRRRCSAQEGAAAMVLGGESSEEGEGRGEVNY
jgi:hypothetical protein